MLDGPTNADTHAHTDADTETDEDIDAPGPSNRSSFFPRPPAGCSAWTWDCQPNAQIDECCPRTSNTCPCSSNSTLFWHKSVADTRGSSSNNCVLTTYKQGVPPLLPCSAVPCYSCALAASSAFHLGQEILRQLCQLLRCRSYPTPLPLRNVGVCGTRSAQSGPEI